MTRTQTYWINRSNQRMDRYILDAEQQADLISQSYYQASKYVEEEMAKVIKNLAVLSDDQTAIAALKKSPNKKLLNQLRSAVNTMSPGPERDKALTLLASPSYQLRLRQLQTTIDNARRECERMYQMELNSTTEHLRNLYDDAFLHSVYDIDKGYNALHSFSMFPASRVDKLLKTPWSGEQYSERIWGRTQALAEELRMQMMVAFMTGSTVSETSAAIRSKFESSAYAARRLVRTETNFIANQAELDSYKRLGIEEYKYIATLDTRTSRLCQELDGQVFKTEDGKAGVNLPPMHPNCRSTTIMYDEEEPLKERTARDENGNRITVPGNMKYKEWLEKYHPELLSRDELTNNRASGKIKPYEIKKPREERLAIIRRGLAEDRPIFAYDTEDNKFASYVKNVKHKKGFYDVALHGSPTQVDFFGDPIDAYTLSKIILGRHDYAKGVKVRLLSCSTGDISETGDCFAQILANQLGVIVEAPTLDIYVYESGEFEVGPFNEGEMKLFYPRE